MKKQKYIVKFIVTNLILLVTIYLLYKSNIRICFVYNVFKIPCAGCGLTRSVINLIKGNIKESLSYNILTIPLILFYIIYLISIIFNKKEIFVKYKKIIIILSIIMFVISGLKNIMNPLLY